MHLAYLFTLGQIVEKRTKDSAIIVAIIGAVALVLSSIGAAWLARPPDASPPTQAAPSYSLQNDLNMTSESRDNSQQNNETQGTTQETVNPEPTDVTPSPGSNNQKPACKDRGDAIRGTVCVTPQTGGPGEIFEVSGYDFPPDLHLPVGAYNRKIPPEIHFADMDGTFSIPLESDTARCMTYRITLTGHPKERPTEVNFETIGC